MKRPRLGPELKMSQIKAPDFLVDVYWDLRDRHLLPLLALVAVAIVAVPFVLGGGSKKKEEAAPADTMRAALESEIAHASSLKVVEAKPGLRDYHKRLKNRTPHNPFKQRFTAPVTAGAKLNPETTTTTTTTTGASGSGGGQGGSGSGQAGSAPPSTSGGAPSGTKHGEVAFFSYAINVQITKSGGKQGKGSASKPVVKHGVLPQTPLPGPKAPVVTYMGPGRNEKGKLTGNVLMLVSDEVNSVFGEARCVSGFEVCQLLEVEPNFPIVLSYGNNEVRYKVNVLKLGLIVTARKKYSGRAPAHSGTARELVPAP